MLTSTTFIVEVQGSNATNYTFNQPIHDADDLKVYVAGLEVPRSSGSNPHGVTVAANKQSATIVFTTAPGDKKLKFERKVDYTQGTDLANNSLFDAESLETTLDNIVMQTQQAGLRADVSFGFHPGIAESDYYNSNPTISSTLNVNKTNRSLKALAFDSNGELTVSTDNIDAQITTVAGSASDAEDAKNAAEAAQAAAEAALASFNGIYHGAQTATPSSGVTDGDLWFDTNTDINVMKVYNATGTAWEQLTPSSSNQTNINAAVADQADIGVVAGLDTEIGLLGALNTEIGLIGTSAMAHVSTGHIKKVADIHSHVSAVSGISTAVSGVNTISASVSAVHADAVDIGKVAAIDTEVGKVAAIDTEISNIGTDAYSHASTGYIKLVADDATDIGVVAGKATEIGLLGTSAMAHASTGNLTLLGTSAMAHASTGYLKLVGDIDDKIITVAGISGNVTSVANDATDIGTVATDLTGDDTIGTVAGAIADVNRYANEYKIALSEPGSPSEGDIWMDTTNHVFKVHNGTAFVTVTEGQTAAEVTAEATAQAISMSIALG